MPLLDRIDRQKLARLAVIVLLALSAGTLVYLLERLG